MPTAVGALMGSPSFGRVATAARRNAKSTVPMVEWGVAEREGDLTVKRFESYGTRARTSRRSGEGRRHESGRHPGEEPARRQTRGPKGTPKGCSATFHLRPVTEEANGHVSH